MERNVLFRRHTLQSNDKVQIILEQESVIATKEPIKELRKK
jgi:hypothetical protein